MSYEELAEQLLTEPPARWPAELAALSGGLKPVPERVIAAALAAAGVAAGTKAQAPSVSGRTTTPPGRPDSGPTGRRAWSLAAAALVLGVVGVGIFFLVRQGQAPSQGLRALVEYARGKVTASGQLVKTGDLLSEKAVVEVTAGGVCVLEVASGQDRLMVRLGAESQLALQELRTASIGVGLSRGAALVDYQRGAPPAGTKRTDLHVIAPTAVASVRGTTFGVEVTADGGSLLSVFEGQVAFRRYWPELERLPAPLIEAHPVLRNTRAILRNASTAVPAERQSAVPRADLEARIARVRALSAALAESDVASLRGKLTLTESERRAALAVLARHFPNKQSEQRAVADSQAAFGPPPPLLPKEDAGLTSIRERLEGDDEAEREARYRKLLERMKAAGPQGAEMFRREAGRVLGRKPQQVKLMSGETIYGSVFGNDEQYIIYTDSGIRKLPLDAVKEIHF